MASVCHEKVLSAGALASKFPPVERLSPRCAGYDVFLSEGPRWACRVAAAVVVATLAAAVPRAPRRRRHASCARRLPWRRAEVLGHRLFASRRADSAILFWRVARPHGIRICVGEVAGRKGAALEAEDAEPKQAVMAPRLLLLVVAALYGSLGICMRLLYSLSGPPTPAALSFVRQALTVAVFVPALGGGRAPRTAAVRELPCGPVQAAAPAPKGTAARLTGGTPVHRYWQCEPCQPERELACGCWHALLAAPGFTVTRLIYADGCCLKHWSRPQAARAGWGPVTLENSRAEFRAVIQVLLVAVPPFCTHTDHLEVILGLARGRAWAHCPRRSNRDLWVQLWAKLDDHGGPDVRIVHARGHQSSNDQHRHGNTWADALARWGLLCFTDQQRLESKVYFSAATKQLMPTVSAEDVASAVPVPAELIAEYFPAGAPEGFIPMVCGGGAPSMPVPEMPQAVAGAVEQVQEAADGVTEKKKKSKKSKKDQGRHGQGLQEEEVWLLLSWPHGPPTA
ncbi:unnamed protein product [Prorocentrum cordatum]|uniref:RNase H type-1 domain-containing protein n=1 Tax=Prorocentrum cordatum TaxID=2364126 RepID=A0ABN9WJ24_9DINO|nr:unnamed protein product [Polarella glacialis]